MKKILVVLIVINLLSCDFWGEEYDGDDVSYDIEQCVSGQMKCESDIAYMCNYQEWWETFKNCKSISQKCYYNDLVRSSGYPNLAVCD